MQDISQMNIMQDITTSTSGSSNANQVPQLSMAADPSFNKQLEEVANDDSERTSIPTNITTTASSSPPPPPPPQTSRINTSSASSLAAVTAATSSETTADSSTASSTFDLSIRMPSSPSALCSLSLRYPASFTRKVQYRDCLIGTRFSQCEMLLDQNKQRVGFFVFWNVAIRLEGEYRFKFSLKRISFVRESPLDTICTTISDVITCNSPQKGLILKSKTTP